MGQAAQLGQQGSDHGQYGQTPMATPYGMNGMANANQQQNENTQSVGNYSPMLPSGGLMQGQPKLSYPGMYPSTSPQFGTNPYAPQTANFQGHPGHNPSTFPSVEPNANNSAMSNQGQFVQRMASGGSSNQPAMFRSPQMANQGAPLFPGYSFNTAGGYYTNDQGQKFLPSYGQPQQNSSPFGIMMGGMGGYGGNQNRSIGNGWYMSPVGGKGASRNGSPFGKGAEQVTLQPSTPTPPSKPSEAHVYKPAYAQPTVAFNPNLDSAGLPIFNNGGSIKE
jgi:hypothetical protein